LIVRITGDAGASVALQLLRQEKSLSQGTSGAGNAQQLRQSDMISLSKEAQRVSLMIRDDVVSGSSAGTTINFSDGYVQINSITGNGDDHVDLTQSGAGYNYYRLDTNAGDDVVDIKFGTFSNQSGIMAGAGDDRVTIDGGYNTVNAGDGNDVITFKNARGTIGGGGGNDTISLSFDENVPEAKRWASKMKGTDSDGNVSERSHATVRQGATLVEWARGHGNDTVNTQLSGDIKTPPVDLQFLNLKRNDIALEKNGADLVFTIEDTKETLTLKDFDARAWKEVEFSGEVWDLSDLMKDSGVTPST
jgi:hypothetical protein